MPKPTKGETQKAFVSRCIPIVLNDGTAKDQKQAAAICYSLWKQHAGKSSMNRIMNLPRMTRDAEMRAETFDGESNTVSVVWTTGARVRRRSWVDGPYDEELLLSDNSVRLGRLNAGASFLNTHDAWDLKSVIGSVVRGSARLEDGKGVATIQLSRAPEDAATVQKIKDGIIRNISVGYWIHKIEKTEGQEGDVPLWRVVDWEPIELSAVAVPADPGAHVRAAALSEFTPCVIAGPNLIHPAGHTAHRKDSEMSKDIEQAAEASAGGTSDAASEEAKRLAERQEQERRELEARERMAADKRQREAEEKRRDEEEARETARRLDEATATKRAKEEGRRDEQLRVNGINEVAEKFKHVPSVRTLADQAIKDGNSVNEFRIRLQDLLASLPYNTEPGNTRVGFGHEASEDERKGFAMEVALLHRIDPQGMAKEFDACPEARLYRGMSLLEMGRECLEFRNGTGSARGLSRMDLASRALEMRSDHSHVAGRRAVDAVRVGGLMSTSDFPNILANVITKTLRQGYESAPQTFRDFTRVTTVPDFKEVSRVQFGEAPQLERVNESGEFKRGSIGESVEKYSVATYGKIIGVTRQVLVNDDLNAFSRLPRAFGVQAANLESDMVWYQLLANAAMGDGKNLFDNAHGNDAQTGSGIGITSVSAGRLAMAKQTGLDGVTVLNIEARFLAVPKNLETTAEQFRGQIYPASAANVVPDSMRRLGIISEPRLDLGVTFDGTTIAGSSQQWYLIGDMNQIDIIELAYLEGAVGLFTETRMGFDVDGMEVKVRQDAGAKAIDWRGLYRNSGGS